MALSTSGIETAVREAVYGAEPRNRPYQTALTNAPGTAGTTFSVSDGDAWQAGDLVETAAGELALVTAVATNDLTVRRATGSIAAENLASGGVLKKNPRFTLEQIQGAYEQVMLELPPRVYKIATETIAYTTDKYYDVVDTEMEEVYSAWYIDGTPAHFYTTYYHFLVDPANDQPKIFLAAAGFSGNVFLTYRSPYTAVTEMPDRLLPMMVAGTVYKLLGGSMTTATSDIGKRTDRTVQGGQEQRDSYWWFREFARLRDTEVAYLRDKVARLPMDRMTQRARRFRK